MAFRSRGLPSTGCNKCRSRKVRCDEAKPVCERCKKLGFADCKYRDEFERTWRHHTEQTLAGGQLELAVSSQASSKVSPPIVIHQLPPESSIFERFYYDWAIENDKTPGMSISWFNALPTLYKESPEHGLLSKSIKALAYANYAQRCNHAESHKQAAEIYGTCLRLLRESLLSTVNVSKRDVLASTVLLGIYETLTDKSGHHSGNWLSHMGGASTLLKGLRQNPAAQQSPMDIQISRMIFRQMLHGSLISGRKPAVPELPPSSPPQPGPRHMDEHIRRVHTAAVLCSEWRAAFDHADTPEGLQSLTDIVWRALALKEDLVLWTEDTPPMCNYEEVLISTDEMPEWLRSLLSAPGAPQYAHAYSSLVAEMLWRFYWEARLILCQALLYTSKVLLEKQALVNPVLDCQQDIENCLLFSAQRLLESAISPMVNANRRTGNRLEVGMIQTLLGYLMLQPLPTVGHCLEQIDIVGVDLEVQKAWVTRMRLFLSHDIGVSKASANLGPDHLTKLPVQLWSLTRPEARMLGLTRQSESP